jgi:hypothetical protein
MVRVLLLALVIVGLTDIDPYKKYVPHELAAFCNSPKLVLVMELFSIYSL